MWTSGPRFYSLEIFDHPVILSYYTDMNNLQIHIQHWRKSAERDLGTATDLYHTKHYDACLFFCHLTLEKFLKSIVVQRTDDFAPPIHDLAKLASTAHITLTSDQVQLLRTITTFNIAGRYDDAKLAFYKQCTPPFTKKYLAITKGLYLWLEQEFQKKS